MNRKNVIIGTILFALIMMFSVSFVYATGVFSESDIQNAITNNHGGSSSLNAAARGVWDFIKTAIQFLAIGAVILAGVRYMIASADQKADIKKSMTTLAIGAVIVFASTTVIDFIVGVVKNFTE